MPAKRTSSRKPAPPPFKPQKTAYSPPDLCWEIVLSNPQTTAAHLRSWRWIWLLPQVARAFRAGLEQERWMRSMCADESKSLMMMMIWKSKANAIFALTASDMADVVCKVVRGVGWMKCRETHLMRCDTILQLALDKHGGTFKSINDAFLKRAEAKRMRKKNRPRKPRCFSSYYNTDCSDCDDNDDMF